MNTISQIFVGVDVAKDFLDVHIHPTNKSFRVANNNDGIAELAKHLTSHKKIEQIVCEATGGREKLMQKELSKKRYNVWVVDPNRIRAFIRSEGIRVKTDKIDAKMIALFASQKRPSYQQVQLTEEQEQLRAFTKCRTDLVRIINKQGNRRGHPQEIYCQDILDEVIAFLKEKVSVLDSRIGETIKKSDEFAKKEKIIKSVPGIGPVITSTVIAYLPELGTITGKQASSMAGVAPVIKQSGFSKGIATTSGGRGALRSVLWMGAQVAVRFNKKLKAFYERLLQAGKKKKVALVAVMRRIIVILNAMVRKGEQWVDSY